MLFKQILPNAQQRQAFSSVSNRADHDLLGACSKQEAKKEQKVYADRRHNRRPLYSEAAHGRQTVSLDAMGQHMVFTRDNVAP